MKKFIKSCKNALRGIGIGIKRERNIRIHLFSTLIVALAGLYFNLDNLQWSLITFAVGLVWTMELINSSVERLADRITTKTDESIRDVKDLAAGAVLFAVFTAIAIGVFIFVPKAIEKFGF